MNSNETPRLTREEFDKIAEHLSVDIRDQLWAAMESVKTSRITSSDYSSECSMCGVEMSYRYCGMCTRCEMVWNS